ncbi:class I SAM-dependent methyltransferase [bacterium]|nr:class I SAM-dependent methyltransferase [bacterium]
MQNAIETTEQNSYTTLDKCVACGGSNLEQFLDLAEQPLANNYHDGTGGGESFRLGLNLCTDCYHTQLPVSVDPKAMFDHYLYVTGTSQTLRDYCDWFAQFVTDREQITHGNILDIACNDGTQLDSFRKLGWKTFGVDPAKNLFDIALEKGHMVRNAYWPISYPQMDVITAQNVCAHTPNPLDFLEGVKKALTVNGTAYIQTSQSQMYQRNEFDTTYHEHISFFSANSMNTLAKRAGLVLTDIEITPIHGDSYVFVLKHEGADVKSSVTETIRKEGTEGRHNSMFYKQFGINAESIVRKLKDLVTRCQAEGIPVVGYGAAAKGMTVLNANDIQLDWIVDDNELKQGLLTPGTNIPIKDKSSLDIDEHIVVIPLAWNFFNEIKANVEEVRQNKSTQYVQYFPRVMFVV